MATIVQEKLLQVLKELFSKDLFSHSISSHQLPEFLDIVYKQVRDKMDYNLDEMQFMDEFDTSKNIAFISDKFHQNIKQQLDQLDKNIEKGYEQMKQNQKAAKNNTTKNQIDLSYFTDDNTDDPSSQRDVEVNLRPVPNVPMKNIPANSNSWSVALNGVNNSTIIKNLAKNIININHIYNEAERTIRQCNKRFGMNLYMQNDVLSLKKFLTKLTDEATAKCIFQDLLREDSQVVKAYFNTLLFSWFDADPETLKVAWSQLINNYDILEELFFKNYGETAVTIIENRNLPCYYAVTTKSAGESVKIKDTGFKYWIGHLDEVWDRYGEKLFKRARRGPKMMLTLYFVFQEKFTNEMFEVLCDRMKGYKHEPLIMYILNHSRHLPEDFKNRLAALKLTLSIKD